MRVKLKPFMQQKTRHGDMRFVFERLISKEKSFDLQIHDNETRWTVNDQKHCPCLKYHLMFSKNYWTIMFLVGDIGKFGISKTSNRTHYSLILQTLTKIRNHSKRWNGQKKIDISKEFRKNDEIVLNRTVQWQGWKCCLFYIEFLVENRLKINKKQLQVFAGLQSIRKRIFMIRFCYVKKNGKIAHEKISC